MFALHQHSLSETVSVQRPRSLIPLPTLIFSALFLKKWLIATYLKHNQHKWKLSSMLEELKISITIVACKVNASLRLEHAAILERDLQMEV